MPISLVETFSYQKKKKKNRKKKYIWIEIDIAAWRQPPFDPFFIQTNYKRRGAALQNRHKQTNYTIKI